MRHQIRRFGIAQTAKVLGALYGLAGLLLVPIFLVVGRYAPNESGLGMGFAIAIPIMYAVIGFIVTAIGCAIYNLVAGWVGGIELELDTPATPG
jgi:hypothetical protein